MCFNRILLDKTPASKVLSYGRMLYIAANLHGRKTFEEPNYIFFYEDQNPRK